MPAPLLYIISQRTYNDNEFNGEIIRLYLGNLRLFEAFVGRAWVCITYTLKTLNRACFYCNYKGYILYILLLRRILREKP